MRVSRLNASFLAIVLLLCCPVHTACMSANPHRGSWVQHWDGLAHSVYCDDKGNIYVTGTTRSNELILTGWTKTKRLIDLGHPLDSKSTEGYDLAVDRNGNIFVTGTFGRTISFQRGSEQEQRQSLFTWDYFLFKMTPRGEILWLQTWPGIDYLDEWYGVEFALDLRCTLDLDDAGNVYVAGLFNRTVDFDPGPGAVEYTAQDDYGSAFISSFAANGEFRWACAWNAEFSDMVATRNGDIYAVGSFIDDAVFDSDSDYGTLTTNSRSACLCRFTKYGDFVSAYGWGGAHPSFARNVGCASADAIALAQDGELYIAGDYERTLRFHDERLKGNEASDNAGLFLCTVDEAAGRYNMVTWPGMRVSQVRSDMDLIFAENGNLLLLANFIGSFDIDPGSDIREISSPDGYIDILLACFDGELNFKWADTFGGQHDDWAFGAATDRWNNIYITGLFDDPAAFEGTVQEMEPKDYFGYGFLIKVKPNGSW